MNKFLHKSPLLSILTVTRLVKPDKISKGERKENLFDRSDLRIRFQVIMEVDYNRFIRSYKRLEG
jgi:hypothetical protein